MEEKKKNFLLTEPERPLPTTSHCATAKIHCACEVMRVPSTCDYGVMLYFIYRDNSF